MFHVVYVSHASREFSAAELLQLLEISRRRNARLLLTGLLLYADRRFMQVLEGSETAVREVFDSILRDERHTDVHTLRLESKPQRHFPDWSMAFENLAELGEAVTGASSFLQPGFEGSTLQQESSDVYELLRAFRDEHAAAAVGKWRR
ncbi:MAG: BLUF domain-containing protein [Pseudomonadales bacterium]